MIKWFGRSAPCDEAREALVKIERWTGFQGLLTTPQILAEKAALIAQRIILAANDPLQLAMDGSGSRSDPPSSVAYARRSRLEGVALGARIVDELVANELHANEHKILMRLVQHHLEADLCRGGLSSLRFREFMRDKQEDYWIHKKWPSSTGGGFLGTLFWEYGTRQANILGRGNDKFFIMAICVLLQGSIERWNIPALLEK